MYVYIYLYICIHIHTHICMLDMIGLGVILYYPIHRGLSQSSMGSPINQPEWNDRGHCSFDGTFHSIRFTRIHKTE